MDRHILFVTSEIDTTRAQKNRNLVSFHKRFECCFNATVFENIGVKPGMYARFVVVDKVNRLIKLHISKDRPLKDRSKWYKIRNPQVSKYNRYCYIRTTTLAYDFEIILLGAFEYIYFDNDFSVNEDMKVVYIKY